MYKIPSKAYPLLVEALRRFECFAVRRDGKEWTMADLQSVCTGLGTATDYKPAVNQDLMKVVNPNKRYYCWWTLTEKGAKIVLYWHEQGYGCGDGWQVQGFPPQSVPDID